MEFILASSNEHKAQELTELLSPVSILPAAQKLEVIEDGNTFEANALKKAQAYFNKFKKPIVSDDSGLVLPSRPDILAVHSARYAPHLEDYKDKNEYLINELKDLKGNDRKAYFACTLCFYYSEDSYFFFEGRVHGVIGQGSAGEDGFGYDPIFFPDGCDGKSMAQLPDWKAKNSHRAKACMAAKSFLVK
jgi:XTP/dITP diphosphohydrolase